MEQAVDKPKVLFSYINSRLKNKETVAVLKGENNEDIIENDAKAENLSRFFVSVFTDETDFDEAGSPAGTTDEIIENIDFTEEDVRKELLTLKEGKSPGPDQIPAKVLKELSCELAKPLWHIFRSSFDRGILTSDWKVANIYPIHKGGSRTSTNNYRPATTIFATDEDIKECQLVILFLLHREFNELAQRLDNLPIPAADDAAAAAAENTSVENRWCQLRDKVQSTALAVLGRAPRQHQDCLTPSKLARQEAQSLHLTSSDIMAHADGMSAEPNGYTIEPQSPLSTGSEKCVLSENRPAANAAQSNSAHDPIVSSPAIVSCSAASNGAPYLTHANLAALTANANGNGLAWQGTLSTNSSDLNSAVLDSAAPSSASSVSPLGGNNGVAPTAASGAAVNSMVNHHQQQQQQPVPITLQFPQAKQQQNLLAAAALAANGGAPTAAAAAAAAQMMAAASPVLRQDFVQPHLGSGSHHQMALQAAYQQAAAIQAANAFAAAAANAPQPTAAAPFLAGNAAAFNAALLAAAAVSNQPMPAEAFQHLYPLSPCGIGKLVLLSLSVQSTG
nr:unnamed protein product [Spirometra erinaceieuropaei]